MITQIQSSLGTPAPQKLEQKIVSDGGDILTKSVQAQGVLSRSVTVVSGYIALTKPRVIELLLISTVPIMLLADRGSIHLTTILITLFGGWLGAGAANTLNMVVDADIDAQMNRTKSRPLANASITTRSALVFGLILLALSMIVLGIGTNLLAALLVLGTVSFYIFVYTMWLKRRTWQNVIWGGIAGCMPALVGWSAQTGSLSWQPWALFLVVFLWTPPHTWALAMHYREDYEAAGVPMLPVIREAPHVTRQMLWYTIATVLASGLLIFATGWFYALVAFIAGVWFIAAIAMLDRKTHHQEPIQPMKIFILSNTYLAVVCLAIAIDSLLDLPVFHL